MSGQVIVSERHGGHLRLAAYKLEEAHAWDDEWSGYSPAAIQDVKRYYRRYPVLYPMLVRHLPRQGEVLEAGSGLGHWVSLLQEAGFRVRGVDTSEEALARSRQTFPGLSFERGDATALPFEDGRFTGYFSFGLAEHFPEGPEGVLREAARVLADGGVMVASVPWICPLRRWRPRPSMEPPARSKFYQYFFTRREFHDLVESCGFEVLAADAYGTLKALRDEWKGLGRIRAAVPGPSAVPARPPATGGMRGPAGLLGAVARRVRRRAHHLLVENPAMRAMAGHMTVVAARRRPRPASGALGR